MQTSGPPPSAPPPPPAGGGGARAPVRPGFAPAPGFGHPTGGFAMPPPPRKGLSLGKIVVIGCGALALLTCAAGAGIWAFAMYTAREAGSHAEALSHSLATDIMRAGVVASLTGVQSMCATGDCAPAAQYLHPGVQSALTPVLPTVTQKTIQVLEDRARTSAELLEGTDDAVRATALGLTPSSCVRLTSGRAKVVGCSAREANGAETFLLVHLEGLESLE